MRANRALPARCLARRACPSVSVCAVTNIRASHHMIETHCHAPRRLQEMDDAHSSLSGFASFSSSLTDIKAGTADKIQTLINGHAGLAQTIDKWCAAEHLVPGPCCFGSQTCCVAHSAVSPASRVSH